MWQQLPKCSAIATQFVGDDYPRLGVVPQQGQSGALALEGGAGIGKTTLALTVAYQPRILEYFSDGILWASLGQQATVENQQAIWAQALGIDPARHPRKEDLKRAMRSSIGDRRLLLVIDDAWGIKDANLLRCGGPNCCHLLTSRDEDIARAFASVNGAVPVVELTLDDAYKLLSELAPEICQSFPKETRELCDQLYGLPLTIELVGAYLAGSQARTFKSQHGPSWVAMQNPEQRLKQARVRLGSTTGVAQTLKEAVELSLADLDNAARGAFCSLGAFAPKPARFDLESATVVTQVDEAVLSLLANRNLCDVDEHETLTVHPAVIDVAQACTPKAAYQRHAQYYLTLINQNRENWRLIQTNYDQAIQAIEHSLNTERQTFVAFVWALRIYHDRRGLWQVSLDHYHRALGILREMGDREGEATILNNIGSLYDVLGDRKRALAYYEEALPIRREVGDRAGEAITLNNLGSLYDGLGYRGRAPEYYKKALSIQREVGDRAGEAATLKNMGRMYDKLGDQQRALAWYQEALCIYREGRDRTGEAITRSKISMIHVAAEELQKAIDELEVAVCLLREVGSPDFKSAQARLEQLKKTLQGR